MKLKKVLGELRCDWDYQTFEKCNVLRTWLADVTVNF